MHSDRYIRQVILDRFGKEAQSKLADAVVAVVGCGGLGSVAAPYLAGAGVGRLILIDGDTPHISNLHRQVFFSEEDSTVTKSKALTEHIYKLNSEIQVEAIEHMVSKENIASYLGHADLVLECTDNIQAKYLINDYCHIHRIPVVYGAIHKYDGYVSTFDNTDSKSIHLRDIFPVISDDVPTCSEVGVMGTLAGIIGLLQANEAVKYVSGVGTVLSGQMLSYDILSNRQMILTLSKCYDKDLTEVFENSDYVIGDKCSLVPEMDWSELQRTRQDFRWISILEDDEHVDLADGIIRMPLSGINDKIPVLANGAPYVVYCLSGRRSAAFVERLQSEQPDLVVYSLSGGLQSVR